MIRFLNQKKLFVLPLLILLALALGVYVKKGGAPGTDPTSLKPQIELVREQSLGGVAEDKIPDVTREKWSMGIPNTRPVVSPDGKYVLAVGEAKMTMYDTASGMQVWEKPTSGGIDNYVFSDGRLYLTEKYGNKQDKEHGHIICLDAQKGEEMWKYDVQQDLAPIVRKYKPADAKTGISCYLKISAFENRIFVNGYSTWMVEKAIDKAEILLCLDRNGKAVWKVESRGYPGIWGMSEMKVISGKLVMGSYSYGDSINGPAGVQAYDINTGKKLWQYDIRHDGELACNSITNVAAGIAGDKVVAVTNFGKVYVLDQDGNKISEFVAFRPVKQGDATVCTNVWGNSAGFGKNEIILSPQKSVVKGSSNYYAKPPVEHPDAGSAMVYDLSGNLKWKIRLGGQATNMAVRENYLTLTASHNQDNMDYSYCGVYVFDLSRKTKGPEINAAEKTVLDRYLGYYQTDGVVLGDGLGVSDSGKVICAATWPTRAGAEKHGKHSLYILKIK